MEYVIETQNLVKQYKEKFAVDDISIHVKRGDIYGLIGKNGAGKTTLMKLILGLAEPTKGKVFIFGNEELNAGRRKIGSLIEAPGLYKSCTAYENMMRFSVLYGSPESEIRPILEKVGIANTGKKKAGEFSLGMRQRLGLAIAFLAHPEILVLDEPINGLDPAGIKEIRDIIIELNNAGVTFIISSHLLDELAKVVTTYGIIINGKLTEEISAKDLQARFCKYIKIVGCDNQIICEILRKNFENIIVVPKNDGVYLSNYHEKITEIIKLLVKHDIPLTEVANVESGLEEYFINRLGR